MMAMRSALGGIVALLLSSCWISVAAGDVSAVQIRNQSLVKLEINWVHPTTKKATPMGHIVPNETWGVNSFVGHEFQIVEVPDEASGACDASKEGDQTCKVNYIQVTRRFQQYVLVKKGLEVEEQKEGFEEETESNEGLEPAELLEKCKEEAKKKLESVKGDTEKEQSIMEEYDVCLKGGLVPKLMLANDEIVFQTSIREYISDKMENFTCLDADMGSSPDVETLQWTSERDNVTRTVHVKLERSASRIHVVSNFAYPEECAAMQENAESKLSHASVADGKGGSQISVNRKAMQASISPQWKKEADGDLITRLSRRVFDYTNRVLGLNVSEQGQEPLMSIQYEGRGYNDTQPDRYTPHCDGRCTGEPHMYGNRMATMVIYCTIPERGGHTNFQNAGVHVKPEVGAAVFFSYIDPETNKTDLGLTQHSGCPVYEGEKKIITQWIRYGVDSFERHNNRFNTLGILKKEDGE